MSRPAVLLVGYVSPADVAVRILRAGLPRLAAERGERFEFVGGRLRINFGGPSWWRANASAITCALSCVATWWRADRNGRARRVNVPAVAREVIRRAAEWVPAAPSAETRAA